MCDYCKGKYLKENEPIFKNQYWEISIDVNNKELEIWSEFESNNEIDIKINYCPICGKKLK